MAKIKLLEDVQVAWWVETIQGKVEVDGEVVEFRYSENPKGVDCYIWDEESGRWTEEYDEKYNCIFDVCGSLEINKDSEAGEEFESEDYE